MTDLLARRRFLKRSLAGSALISLSGVAPSRLLQASAAVGDRPANENVLVVVQLSGGNDGLSFAKLARNPRRYFIIQ